MKLFKRTSIFLLVFILIVWCGILMLSEYPGKNIRVSDEELKQTRQLLEKNNIEISDKLLKRNVRAISVAEVSEKFSDTADAAKKIVGDGAARSSQDEYVSADVSLKEQDGFFCVSGKIDGYNDKSNPLQNAKKLVSSFAIAYEKMEAHVYEKNGETSITFVAEFEGRRVFDCSIKILISSDGSYKIEARPITFKKTGSELAISPCAALAALAADETANGLTVEKMNLGYKVKDDILTPVWEIVSSDDNIFYIQ